MHPIRRVRHPVANSLLLAALSLAACATLSSAQAQSDLTFEPYTVYVAEEAAHARCGPSGEYYRTDPLRHGQSLEVYAETDDGWLGIRPPRDSFCWIPAEAVEKESAGATATVVEDRTVAWIGTHLGRARTYRWQVQLAEGESVVIVGKSEREGPDGPQLWYRIVPPSGEYRWVHRDQVVDNSEALVASIQKPSNGADIEFLPAGTTRSRVASARTGQDKVQHHQSSSTHPNASSRRAEHAASASGRSILNTNGQQATTAKAAPSQAASETRLTAGENSINLAPSNRPPAAGATSDNADNAAEAMRKGGLLASLEFLGRPRLLEIGAALAPRRRETAGDGNWVSGASRPSLAAAQRGTTTDTPSPAFQPGQSIAQVSAELPIGAAVPGAAAIATTSLQAPLPRPQPMIVVPAERIRQIEAEARGADVDRLSLILSRLMAAQATAAEVEPVAHAARVLSTSTVDRVMAGRASLIAERSEQYRRIASRRDGRTLVGGVGPGASPEQGQVLGADASQMSMAGLLVQVYSARTNSPPFALTDNAGRTIAYVTPMPGVNLRPHLNHKVSVLGSQGFLTGLNTPHILASQAARTPE